MVLPLILRILVRHLLGSTTVIMLSSILTYGRTCLPNNMYSDSLAYAAVSYQDFHTVSSTYPAGVRKENNGETI